MIKEIIKRDGRVVLFEQEKITEAIWKAAKVVGGKDRGRAEFLSDQVVRILEQQFIYKKPTVEEVQDIVEKVLIENGHAKTAKAYILYRQQRTEIRNFQNLMLNSARMVQEYIDEKSWKVKENSNMDFSLQGLNNHIVSAVTSNYWIEKIYPLKIKESHQYGDFHIHDLSLLAPYCCGWNLEDILLKGFRGAPQKVSSRPPKHFRSALGMITNFLYTLQGEAAGAMALSSVDTLLAPFVRHDNLDYRGVKQAVQEFIFNMNVPTRVGFQTPFVNFTLDVTVPETYADQPVIIGGETKQETYKEFQQEIDMINKAFCEVMTEGDAEGRVFTFPIPTYNVTADFFKSPNAQEIMQMTAKYGIPYFANFINSDLDPSDVRSMCCRLRLNLEELIKRGGGLFGAHPLTGSIGVVTINLARIGYKAKDINDFKGRLRSLAELAKDSLLIKRNILEQLTESGLYPYSRYYLKSVKDRFGKYWSNHFNTIGIIGAHESLLNFIGKGIDSPEGHAIAKEILSFLRELLIKFQEETGQLFNLEATPAEGASYRLALADKELYPDIITSGTNICYYTNSTQMPVAFNGDLFDILNNQEQLQTQYTGGTVLHLYAGEKIEDPHSCQKLIQKVFSSYQLPYLSITPTFSICPDHGYLSGEQFNCPHCGANTEIWSRVVGYYRPIQNWNRGKQEEYRSRRAIL
ncbi:MAG: anaerobic ribonucleoside triphosphate reductase [Firmicutes bacterium ML8_F2]|nr:MAG: anaerobic ribonucleoside triphosphate reductase [Firmicutes bacterium ML8_F2]